MTSFTGATPVMSLLKRQKWIIHLKNMTQLQVSSSFFKQAKNFFFGMDYQ